MRCGGFWLVQASERLHSDQQTSRNSICKLQTMYYSLDSWTVIIPDRDSLRQANMEVYQRATTQDLEHCQKAHVGQSFYAVESSILPLDTIFIRTIVLRCCKISDRMFSNTKTCPVSRLSCFRDY